MRRYTMLYPRAFGRVSYTKDIIYEALQTIPVGHKFILWTPKGGFAWKRVPIKKQQSKIRVIIDDKIEEVI